MERETKTITTPAGKELVLKSYVNARERNALRSIFYNDMSFSSDGKQTMNGGSLVKYEEESIKEMVISYDGKPDFLGELSQGDISEYDFVLGEVNKVIGEVFPKAK